MMHLFERKDSRPKRLRILLFGTFLVCVLGSFFAFSRLAGTPSTAFAHPASSHLAPHRSAHPSASSDPCCCIDYNNAENNGLVVCISASGTTLEASATINRDFCQEGDMLSVDIYTVNADGTNDLVGQGTPVPCPEQDAASAFAQGAPGTTYVASVVGRQSQPLTL